MSPTPSQVQAEQNKLKELDRRPKPPAKPAAPPAVVKAALPAVPDNRTSVQQYLDDVAPATMVGRQIKTSKEHVFATADDGAAVPDNIDFIALCDQTMIGLIRFNGEGNPPDYRMGILYDGFIMPDREALGENDPSTWELGLDGRPSDPWRHFMYLPLQRGDTGELFTYTTSSVTGRRAIGNLLRHYDRMTRTHPDQYPVVRLKVGGFNHRDDRVGWVNVPVLAIMGQHPKNNAARPDTSPAGDMSDSIPF
jgi:hypothetical protein